MPHYFRVGPNIPQTNIPKPTVPQAYIPKPIDPSVVLLGVDKLRTNQQQQVSPFSDYNDPTQINSFADVIWNTLSKNDKLKTRDYGLLSDVGDWNIPFLSQTARAITGTFDLARNTVVEPIKQGNMGAVGINLLVNLGESLDILASPIKGLILDGPEGLIKGSVGRVNYDFDTGNWLLDMFAEILVDPFNWISFGGKAVVSGGIKSILASSVDDVAQAAGNKFLKEGVTEVTQKQLKEKLLKSARRELIDSQGRLIAKNTDDMFNALYRAANRLGTGYFDDAFLKAMADKQIRKLAPQYVTDLRILKGLTGIANVSEGFESLMFKGAMYANFVPVDVIKQVKNFGMFKNYTNKIITEVGQVINGYLNPNELTKLANYKAVTNPKNAKYQKMKVNQILKEGGLDTLSYIDMDRAFSEKAVDAARDIRIAIEEYSETHDFDTLLKKIANSIVPEDMIADSKDLYGTIMQVLTENIKLIKETTNKDGIKVFSNIEKLYEEVRNNVQNIYEYDKSLKKLQKIRNSVASDDIILTKKQQELVQQYKNSNFKYVVAYEKTRKILFNFTELTGSLMNSGKPVSQIHLNNLISRLIKDLTGSGYVSKIVKDVRAFYADAFINLKNCKTVSEAYYLAKELFDNVTYKIGQIQDANSLYTIFKTRDKLSLENIRQQADIYAYKKDFINDLITDIKLDVKNEQGLDNAIKECYKTLNERTIDIDDTETGYFKDMFNAIEKFQDTLDNMPKDIKAVKEVFDKFSKQLKNISNEADNAAKYSQYLIDTRPAIKRYNNITNKINKKLRLQNTKVSYSKQLASLRKTCAGGLEAFDKAIEHANKKTQMYANKTGLVYGKHLEATTEKQTIFSTKNVPIKTTDTPEGALQTFKDLFKTTVDTEGVADIPAARKLLDEMGAINFLSETDKMLEFRVNLINTLNKLEKSATITKVVNGEEKTIDNLKLFKSAKNRELLTDAIEDMSEYISYVEAEVITTFKKLTHRKDITYDEMKKLLQSHGVSSKTHYIPERKHKNKFYTATSPNPYYGSYLNDLVNLIDEAKESIRKVSITDTKNKEFLAGGVGVMYAVKDENLMLLYDALSEDIGIALEMKAFTDFESVPYKELISLINDEGTDEIIRQTAQKFYNDLKQFQALDNFVRRLSTDEDIPDGALRAVMSSLESFKNTQLGDLDIELFTKELYEKINNFIYGVDSPKSLSIENLLTEADIKLQTNIELHKRYMTEFTEAERTRFNKFLENGETHISEDDAFVQEMLIRLFLPDTYIKDVIDDGKGHRIFRNKDGGRIYISDCETSSQRGTINEIAIKALGSDETTVFRVAYHDDWEIPQYDILKKMFPDADYNTAVKKYKALYDPNTAVNKQLMEEGKVIFFDSEKELLESYKYYLDGFNMADEVIMHNGAQFDYPVIRQRAAENKVYLNSTKIKLSDSLVGMKDNLPLINIDSAAQIKINNYIKQYLSELPDDDPTTFFLTAAHRDILNNITDFEKLLSNDTTGKTYNETLIQALTNLKNKYYDLLSVDDKISSGANDIFISKEFFQTRQGQDILTGEIKRAKYTTEEMLKKDLTPVQKAEYETYLKSLNDTLELIEAGILTSNNITRMMYVNRFEGDPALGFWKAVDLDTARNYMDIPDTAKLSMNELKAITNFTRPLKNTYNAIKNTQILLKNKKAIADSLRNLLKEYKQLNNAPSWLHYIRINEDDYKTNYIVLQKLYNKFSRNLESELKTGNTTNVAKEIVGAKQKYIDGEVKKVIETLQTGIEVDLNSQYKFINNKLKEVIPDADVKNILDNSSELVFKKSSTEDTLFGKFKSSIQSGEFYETSQTYKQYKDKFNNIVNTGLTALSDSIDGTIFTSAFKFKTAQQTQVVSDAVDELTKWLDTLPEYKQTKIIEKLTDTTDYMDVNLAKQILELSDDDLLNFVLTNSMVLQLDTNLINSFDDKIITTFMERQKTLKDIGLELDFNKDLGVLTIYPNKSVGFRTEIDAVTGNSLYEINGVAIEPVKLNPIAVEDFLDYLPDNIRSKFKEAQNAMNLLTNNIGTGTTYQPVDRMFYRKVYENLPKNITNNMLDLEYFLKDGLFNGRSRFNTTILGSQKFKSMYGDYIPNNFVKGYINSFITLVSRASDKANYIEMILNKDFSINNGFINELSFDEVRKMLEDAPEFNLACLVYNKSGNIELVDLKLNTEVDFQFAKKNNAVILPYHVFANAYQVINSKMYEEMNPVVRFMTKAMHMYKRGYLMSGGMVMRNTIDTFAKNLNIAQGDAVVAFNKTMEAMKLYTSYNEVLNEIFKASGNQRINKQAIMKYFNSGMTTKMDYQTFSFVHEVLNSGALIGEVKALDNYRLFSKARKEGKDVTSIVDLDDAAIKALSEDFESVKHLSKGFMKANNDIENIQRLSAYMLLQDQGLNFTQSIYRVSKDHFNYSMKSPREKLIELIIPFYTFKLNNLQYWAEALADNPWIAGLFEDIMTPIWDFDDVDENELKYNRSLQYRILSGNVQIADNGLTLKLNPSASDALKLMTNPFGEIYNSIFAPYTFITDCAMTQIAESTGNNVAQSINSALNIYKPANPTTLDTVKSLINLAPYGAIAQRLISGVQYAKEIESIFPAIAPSIFGRTKQYEQRSYNKTYTKRGYSKKSYRKKVYPRKTYPRRIYDTYRRPYDNYYPINFKNIYIDGMYSVPNISTHTAKANRYYHFSRLNRLPTVSIYDKLYTSKGKSRWDSMMQTVTPQNLKYVIKNTVHYK